MLWRVDGDLTGLHIRNRLPRRRGVNAWDGGYRRGASHNVVKNMGAIVLGRRDKQDGIAPLMSCLYALARRGMVTLVTNRFACAFS